ncbi:hypothetical protein [Nonomuraea dietziae]|uniref:hypothetical protein n=1 Tax=Nonomuraea dietziae TaxID=65515 RepID=UPI00342A9AC4
MSPTAVPETRDGGQPRSGRGWRIVAALCAPLVGRLLDAYGGRGLMSAGSVLGTLAVLTWSRVDSLLRLYAVFVAIGVACSMVLYESALAVIVSRFDGPARARGRPTRCSRSPSSPGSPPRSSCRSPACWWSGTAGASSTSGIRPFWPRRWPGCWACCR